MSTGSQGASESARASSGASSERRSRTARRARFRSPIRVAAEPDVHHRRTAYPADDDLVFGHPQLGTPLERSRLLKRYKRAARAAGIRDIRFHDLRHTFGTRMAAAAAPMRTLQEWMGHRDYKTTLIYADLPRSPLRG